MSRPTPEHQLFSIVRRLRELATEVVDAAHAAALRVHATGLAELAEDVAPRLPPNALTPAQANVLAYIRRCIAQDGQAPTRKEIADAFSYASPNAAQDHLRALERKGHLTLTGEPRGIRVTPPVSPSSKAHP